MKRTADAAGLDGEVPATESEVQFEYDKPVIRDAEEQLEEAILEAEETLSRLEPGEFEELAEQLKELRRAVKSGTPLLEGVDVPSFPCGSSRLFIFTSWPS